MDYVEVNLNIVGVRRFFPEEILVSLVNDLKFFYYT